MRALKEEIVVLPSPLSLRVDQYQTYCEYAISRLDEFEKRLIQLRFLECLSIAKIADLIGRTWIETDKAIDLAVNKIRNKIQERKNKKY